MAPGPSPYAPPALPVPFTNTTPPPALLTQGAEAHLYKTTFLTPSTPAALKIRPSKPYRHPILDKRLTRQRVLQEARCLVKLVREGVNVPGVLAVDWEAQGGENGRVAAWLLMEWIDGLVVRVVFERWEAWIKQKQRELSESDFSRLHEEEAAHVRGLMRRIGHTIGGMHKAGVIHGDLTTSNLILRPTQNTDAPSVEIASTSPPSMEGEIVLIDFGLAGQSVQDEDRAVDLYVLERAFGSTHPKTEGFFEDVVKAYGESYRGANVVLKRLEDVRMRGRKRSMIG
ncbi:serine/threonine-protein kinase bud32 [Paecilomyces lecythidis]|uniref:EKC/KEOPS complex subunit BUD32 n=1 Tax=Paecilomyces lecythidis TaxID=3004212 RepID=A0ABR3WXV2_9EURO